MAIKRAKESFTYWDKQGVPRDIPAGTLIDPATSPEAYSKREHLFEDAEMYVENRNKGSVEKATAEPGEVRDVTSIVKKYQRPTDKESK